MTVAPPFNLDTTPTKPKPEQKKAETIKSLKVGDIVYLKSGSGKMTVTAILDDNVIEATWCHYDSQEMRVWNLPLDALRVDW